MRWLSLTDICNLSYRALTGAGASQAAASIVAESIRDAEADGIRLIGLEYLPVYCRHVKCGKVDGHAVPTIRSAGAGLLCGDAQHGFCHVAFVQGESRFLETTHQQGIAGFGLSRSYASGVLGWFIERIANAGLVGLGFSNASPTMAPQGGRKPVFGTNPIALAVPRAGTPPLVIDFSPAATTRLEIKRHRTAGESIPIGCGLDGRGRPTEDPAAVLDGGAVAPAAGHKSSALALLVEVLAAGLTGARWSFEASDLGTQEGGPPEIGQFFIAIDPKLSAGSTFHGHIENLISAMLEQDGVRLPGDRRLEHRRKAWSEGVAVPEELLAEIEAFGSGAWEGDPN